MQRPTVIAVLLALVVLFVSLPGAGAPNAAAQPEELWEEFPLDSDTAPQPPPEGQEPPPPEPAPEENQSTQPAQPLVTRDEPTAERADDGELPIGLLAVGAGALVALLLVAGLVFSRRKRRRLDRAETEPPEERTVPAAAVAPPAKAAERKPREPVKAKRPEPVEAKRPEPVEAKRPEPVEAKRPEPVEAKRPEPVEAKRPEPVEAKRPEPVEAKRPEPVKAKPPEPVGANDPSPEPPKPLEPDRPKPRAPELVPSHDGHALPDDVIPFPTRPGRIGKRPAPQRALGYVSAADAESQISELDTQTEQIRAACMRHGFESVEVVRDFESHSGSDLERPGLTYAIERLEAGEANALVVASLERLTRSAAHLGTLIDRLGESKIRLVVLDIELDTGDPDGQLAAEALANVGTLERKSLDQRTRKGLQAARDSRRSSGRPAVADRPALKDRIADMRARGMTLQAIADTLNSEGVPTLRGGAEWRPSSVQAAVGYKRPKRGARKPSNGNGNG